MPYEDIEKFPDVFKKKELERMRQLKGKNQELNP